MEEPQLLIPQIRCETKNWTVRVTVAEDIPAITCYTGRRLKRYVFTDREGNKIIACIYDPDIGILAPVLQQYKVYDVTNAQVRPVQHEYRVLDNPTQWVLQRRTLIQMIPEAIPNLRYFIDGLTPFELISKLLKKSPGEDQSPLAKSVDIMGIVVEFEESKVHWVKEKQIKVQKFKFVNMEKIPLKVSLWEEMLLAMGPTLETAARNFSVVVAKRLTVKNYGGLSLSTKNSSSFTIDPPIEAAAELKSWFDSLPESELQSIMIDQPIDVSKKLVCKGSMELYTLAEMDNLLESGDYWVKGFLQISEEYQRLFYVGCSNCHSKIDTDNVGIPYKCHICTQRVVTTLRPFVVMSVSDHTSTVKAIALGDTAETILQNSISNIAELTKSGIDYDLESIRADFNGKQYMMCLKHNSNANNEGRRRLLLIKYFEEPISKVAIQATGLSDQPETSESSSSLSPLKRQMSQINIDTGTVAKRQLTYISEKKNLEEKDTEEPAS